MSDLLKAVVRATVEMSVERGLCSNHAVRGEHIPGPLLFEVGCRDKECGWKGRTRACQVCWDALGQLDPDVDMACWDCGRLGLNVSEPVST